MFCAVVWLMGRAIRVVPLAPKDGTFPPPNGGSRKINCEEALYHPGIKLTAGSTLNPGFDPLQGAIARRALGQ